MHDSTTAQWSHAPRHAEAHLTPDFTCPEHEPEHLSRRVADLRFFIPNPSVLHCPGTRSKRPAEQGAQDSQYHALNAHDRALNTRIAHSMAKVHFECVVRAGCRAFDACGSRQVRGPRGMSRIRWLRRTSSARSVQIRTAASASRLGVALMDSAIDRDDALTPDASKRPGHAQRHHVQDATPDTHARWPVLRPTNTPRS